MGIYYINCECALAVLRNKASLRTGILRTEDGSEVDKRTG